MKVQFQFKFKFKFKFWLAFLIFTIVFSLFNLKAVHDFFFGIDRNERVARMLEWKTLAGETRRASFSIPRGYSLGGHRDVQGEAIALDVMYPSKAFVPWGDTKGPNPNGVYIYIQPGGVHTIGDAIKVAIDNNTLGGNRFLRKVVQTQGDFFTLEKTYNSPRPHERSDTSFLFLDATREHWVESQLQYTTMQIGEGILKDQTASVYYRYYEPLESNPIAMHQWVMAFVENLQRHNPATKDKQL